MKRPIYVTITALLTFVVGALQLGMGVFVVAKRHDAKFLADTSASSSTLFALGLGLIGVGVVMALVAIGLMRGSRLARGIFFVGLVFQLAGGVYSVVTLQHDTRVGAASTIVGALVSFYMLFGSEKARLFFAK